MNFTIDDTFADATRIQSSLYGVYDGLQNAEFLGGRALIYSDIRGGDTDVPTQYFGNVPLFQMLSTDAYASGAWTGGYQTVFAANSFIQNLAANASKVTPAQAAQYTAEARAVRALTYFHLVNLFAQPYSFTANGSHLGVPLQLTAATGATEAFESLPARATVNEVYDQIIKDLTESIPALPTTNSDDFARVARMTRGAAQALLARVYLFKGDYEKAGTAAQAVISSGLYSLDADPQTPFDTYTTKESIFSVAMNIQDNPNTNNAIGQHYGRDRRADIPISAYLALPTSIFPAGDKRRTMVELTDSNIPFTSKFTTVDTWVPMIRYPEVLLTHAEALTLQNNSVTPAAVADLNLVRDRSKAAGTASYTVGSFATAADLLTAIRNERRVELAFEGFRLYDLLRYKQGVPAHGIVPAIPYGDNRLIFPIPNADVLRNPNLVQNPGY
ncbi:RagB/SusD family nutrient uptake outer membrane protein [Hymenobacter sp. BT507]|uniref:RagB/SusD family nutrient uptake outer membrane protein n=1 Tax=Hymenobacter citatus TaxID=2763506 RepID=A0ABR7MJE4_9BACT|nr:RagB/SusD family nutrient uptake outer membrane protein [Hymenobacter citatus]MBC6610722.1 RagB/SusD family nutrient uptake outer membrane protein [Hymenobacter citatus]